MDAIVVEGLKKSYKGVQALAGVSFSVREGEVFGLLGPNGAGKSTTVRILATLSRMDAGRAEVAGHDVRRQAGAVRRSIGYVSQDSGVDQNGTGRENLMLQGRVQGMGRRELRDRVSELLEFVGIADAADRVVKTYSGGMRRRLDIALGLVHRPKVLFLDEPTTGLDPEARAGMWDEVGRLARQERLTILLTTHYLEEADELADRLAIVSRGQIVVEGTPRELKATLRGDAVHLELVDGRMDDARRVLERLGATPESGGEAAPRLPRRERKSRPPRDPLGARAGGDRGRVGRRLASVARRRLPPLHRARLRRRGSRGSMKVLRHTWYMVVRQARNLMREPIWIVLLLVQPMVWLVLYGQLFKNVTHLGGFGTTSYVTFLAPAIVVMNAFFGATWSGMGMIYDLDHKFVERVLATPASRFALVLSQIVRSALTAAIQAVIILVAALGLGVRVHTGAAGWLIVILAAILVNSAFAGISQGIALLTRREATMIAIANFIGLPLLFVSTTLLARGQMPHWMQVAAHGNPMDWGVRAAREVVLPGTSWSTVGLYLVFLLILSAATALWATWCFRAYERTL